MKLIPPKDWNPPFSMKFSKMGITTRIQPLSNLKLGKVLLVYWFTLEPFVSFILFDDLGIRREKVGLFFVELQTDGR